MFPMFFTVWLCLPQLIDNNMNNTLLDGKVMNSSEIYENLLSFPVLSTPTTPLLKETANLCSPKFQTTETDLQQKVQLALDLIVKYNSYNQFVDHQLIWELAENTYSISFGDPHLFLMKCTVQQAVVLTNKQIPVMTITFKNIADHNTATLRIGHMIAKHDDLSPCIFHIRRDELSGIASQNSASHIQIFTLIFLIKQAPLLPKTTLQQLKTEYEAMCAKNVDKYFCGNVFNPKVNYFAILS